ncbi:MAG: cytochrome b/b6 domain-containing protein, partial [Paucibacter sp.]|nr:cytochrome b/b6 domain-containing protein [Roseateles sp.]
MNRREAARRFGSPAIVMHWLMALVLIGLVACVELHEFFPKGSEIRRQLLSWHFMLGVLVPGLLIVRLIVLTRPAPPIVPQPPRWQQLLAKAVQGLLYLLILAMPVLGILTRNADGRAVPFFG